MDNAKKKQIRKITTWVLLAALVAGLAAMPLMAKNKAETDGPVATVLSGTVEEGSISTALHGGGTLSTEDAEDVILPTGVKITEFLVKNGETVTAGTPLAAVDKVSVMTAITSVTETMEYLQDEMQSARNEKVSSTISATAGGRVKQVFAQKGDSVQDVMLEHGALALLSLDGLMAVKIEKKMELPTGQSVTVTLSDGSETNGRVESNLDGVIVITVEDEAYAIGEAVTVTTKDGDAVGSGELYVHSAWSATAYSGTIQTVWAKEETKLGSGATLFTLTDTDFKADLEYMASLHREYEELMQDLFKMYNSGTIDAPCDGTISGIDKDSVHLLAAEGAEQLEVNLLSHTTQEEKGWRVVLLSGGGLTPVQCDPDEGEGCPATVSHDSNCLKACQSNDSCTATERHYPDCIKSCSGAAVCDATQYHVSDCIKSCNPDATTGECSGTKHHKNECIKSCTHASDDKCKDEKYPHYLDCIKACQQSDGNKDCPSTKHKPGCIESCTHADTADACSATTHYPDCIKDCITSTSSDDLCSATKHTEACYFANMIYKAKVALVTDVGSSELVVRWDASGQEYDVEKTASGWKFAANAKFNADLLVTSGKLSIANPSAYKKGDVIFVISGYKGTELAWNGVAVYTHMASEGSGQATGQFGADALAGLSGLMGSMGDLSAMMGGLSGFGSAGFSAASPVEEEALFDLNGSVLMTVSPETSVSLTITVDEQDIAKVKPGQKATVKVEALGGETFDAEVIEVANRGENSGGSSKFAVKLRLSKVPNMIDGMSATASLAMEAKEKVLTIPVAALAEQGAQAVVYTALDKETGEPSNPVNVTIGLSDGITAEILSGLEAGDTYYYSYYDTLELDTGVEERFSF